MDRKGRIKDPQGHYHNEQGYKENKDPSGPPQPGVIVQKGHGQKEGTKGAKDRECCHHKKNKRGYGNGKEKIFIKDTFPYFLQNLNIP